MEMYVYYSIILFSTIIFFLYLYIIWVRITEKKKQIKKQKYEKTLIPLMDILVSKITHQDKINVSEKQILIKNISKNGIKRAIAEERMIYYLENPGTPHTTQLSLFCEEIGLVDKELKVLSKGNVYAKALACKKLGEMRSKRAIYHLLKAVESSSPDVIYNALLALAKIGSPEGFLQAFEKIDSSILLSERSLIEIVDSFEGDKQYIYEKMIDSDNEFVSCIFIKSAGSYQDKELADKIATYLKGDSKEKTISAIKALGGMKDKRYIEDITSHLFNENWEIRAVAAKVLGAFQEMEVIDSLIHALSDSQWFVRYNAASSLLALDKTLSFAPKVFEGEDRFAKDILISVMENNNMLSFDDRAILLIKDYLEQEGTANHG